MSKPLTDFKPIYVPKASTAGELQALLDEETGEPLKAEPAKHVFAYRDPDKQHLNSPEAYEGDE